MLHPTGQRGIVLGPHGRRYRLKGSGWNKRRGRYRQRSQPTLRMPRAAAAKGARR